TPAPSKEAELPEIVELLTLSVALTLEPEMFAMPAPLIAELPETVQLLRVSVPRLRMPPPELTLRSPLVTFPLDMVRPEMFTVPDWILKMRKFGVAPAALRITVRRLAPGPLMVRFLLINNSALVSVIGLVTCPGLISKVIVAPAHAS